jgi:transposase
MPKFLAARPAADHEEERRIRRLAAARHAPADWILRARIVVLSWERDRVPGIAARLGCHEKTVRRWLHRFNADGLDGLGDRPGSGRRPRLTEAERSQIVALARSVPPGRLRWEPGGQLWAPDESGAASWTLDSLAAAAQAAGIDVHRSRVRTILLAEGVRWRRTRSWITSKDPDFAPKGPASWSSTATRRGAPR